MFYDSPYGDAYRWLIDYGIEKADTFMLSRSLHSELLEEGENVLTQLEPFLIRKYGITQEELESRYKEITEEDMFPKEDKKKNEAARHKGIEYRSGTYYVYRCSKEAADILKNAAEHWFEWEHPHLPADLWFLDKDGNDFIHNIAHESMGGIHVDVEEAERINETVPGMFIMRRGHKNNFESFWQDALFHKPRKLELYGFGIEAIPESIGQLKELRELSIHESNVTMLPEALSELNQLEELTVYTADLKEIPAWVGNLTQLKHLRIACGSYHGATDYIIPREEVALTQVPPEIGRLKQLESLSINYTGITDLPEELAQLEKLRYLDLSRNRLREEPSILKRLPVLQNVCLSGNEYNHADHS